MRLAEERAAERVLHWGRAELLAQVTRRLLRITDRLGGARLVGRAGAGALREQTPELYCAGVVDILLRRVLSQIVRSFQLGALALNGLTNPNR